MSDMKKKTIILFVLNLRTEDYVFDGIRLLKNMFLLTKNCQTRVCNNFQAE